MDVSYSNSRVDSSTGNGREENVKSDEHNLQPNPGYRELEAWDNSRFHDCIKAEDWDKLKKLLRRYKSHYYKKKRMQAREIEKEKMKHEEDERTSKKKEEKENEELTRFQRIRGHVWSKNRDQTSKIHRERRTVTVAKKVLPQYVAKKIFVDPADIVSPLLMVDSGGRTPLHLACIYNAPETMILDLLEAEKKASSMKDHACKLPLHCAIQSWQHDHIIERIVKTNPNALKSKDNNGRTPVGLAVELAKQSSDGDIIEDPRAPFLWISPTTKEEKHWQFQQEMRWSRVNCLLAELIDRRRVVIPSEHGLILEALEVGADPNTITRFISTSDRYLMMDDELAGTAIGLCVERHYTFDTVEYLLENCRERTTVITDVVQRALNAHYQKGSYPLRDGMVPFGKRVIDWAKKQQREEKRTKKKELRRKKTKKKKKHADESLQGRCLRGESQKKVSFKDEVDEKDSDIKKKQWTGMKKTCKEWWETLNHLLFYCAYGRDYKVRVKPKTFHLLHAALSAPMTPPPLIHLLLNVYPEAIYEKCPLYKVLPIHIACTRWRYDVINHDSDTSSLDQVLHHLYQSDPDQLCRRHKGSLPIHMALFGGQFWAFLKSFISMEEKLLGMRDAQSKLFSFQIAALPIQFRNVQLLMRCQFNPAIWREMSFLEKKIEYERVVDGQETRQLSTIFELLRRYPDAIENRLSIKVPSTASESLRSLSELSIHYLSWVYSRNSKGGYRVCFDNLTALRNSIVEARILPELEQWWIKVKECIWNDSLGDIPRTNDFLLHSTLYNCETPPLVTELLIQLFPSSAATPIPGTSTYPIHITAGTASYQRQKFEIPYGMNNLRLVLKAYKQATRLKSNGRLPLHICLARGKCWKEVRPLIMVDPSSLKVKDGQTGLAPFQLMASFKLSANENSLCYSTFTEKQMKTFDFRQLTTQEKSKALVRTRKKKELSQLSCIFELIRHRPSILSKQFSRLVVIDDDSANSLHSFVDDSHELRGGKEQWEMFDDSSPVPPLRSNMRSIQNLYAVDEAPALITPLDVSLNRSLSTYLLEKSCSSISCSTPNSTEKKARRVRSKGRITPNSKPNIANEGTKMSLFDFSDLDLSRFDDEQSSVNPRENHTGQTGRAKIPVELPKLEH